MKNLGKIVLIFLCTPLFLYAEVKAYVDVTEVSIGDVVTLNLSMSGEDIKKPNLFSICESDIIATSSQTSIQMINMEYKKAYTLSYKFMPKKSCVIEAIDVVVDAKVEKTQPINIEVKARSKKADSNFELSLKSAKNELYVGEPFDVELLFKQKRSAEALDSKFVAPEFKGFWIKGETQPQRTEEGNYILTKIAYRLAPQREGALEISPAQMSIASRANSQDGWGSWAANVTWKSYFSNDLNITAKALPNGVTLVGDFTINATADKTQINPNEAVNITIEVIGEGNLEDIQSFKPFIQGVSVFDEKIAIDKTKLTQKIAFVADGNFTIEPFTLSYFDLKEQQVKSISTAAIDIEVKGASSSKQELLVKRDETANQTPSTDVALEENEEISLIMGFVLLMSGFIFGIAFMLLQPWSYFKREKAVSIKEPKIVLMKLFPYKDNEEVQKIIDILEKNIYEGEEIQIEKKVLNEIFKKYEIS